MAAEMRKQLEALMGAEALGGIPDNVTYTDPKVCVNYLCGLCPHTLFTNTKMDLGACDKIHSDRLKGEYEDTLRRDPHASLEADFVRNLEAFVADCDRKIAQAQRRLDKTPGEEPRTQRLIDEIKKLDAEIAGKMQEVEILGEEGKVAESMEALKEADRLKADKAAKEKEMQSAGETPSQQQKLRVCEVCSAYLSVFDSDRRLADHFGGKMHMGYVKIRDLLKELKERRSGSSAVAGPSDYRSRGGYSDRGGYSRERDRGERGDRGGGSGGGGGGGGSGSRGDYDRERTRRGYDDRSRYDRYDRDRGNYGGSSRDRDRDRRRSRSRSKSPRRGRY